MAQTITITVTPELLAVAAKAEKAHRELYDESVTDWRQGPGPLRLADFYAAIGGQLLLQS